MLLVREWDQQVGGSGCCGRLNSAVVDALCEGAASPPTVWLLPAIWRDGRRRGLPVRTRLRQLSRGTAPCAVVCDGLAVATDVTPDEAVAAVSADLAARTA